MVEVISSHKDIKGYIESIKNGLNKSAQDAIVATAIILNNEAKATVPVDTGNLKESIYVDLPKDYKGNSEIKPQNIRGKNQTVGNQSPLKGTTGSINEARVYTAVDYAQDVEDRGGTQSENARSESLPIINFWTRATKAALAFMKSGKVDSIFVKDMVETQKKADAKLKGMLNGK
jgi:hypothetical protein